MFFCSSSIYFMFFLFIISIFFFFISNNLPSLPPAPPPPPPSFTPTNDVRHSHSPKHNDHEWRDNVEWRRWRRQRQRQWQRWWWKSGCQFRLNVLSSINIYSHLYSMAYVFPFSFISLRKIVKSSMEVYFNLSDCNAFLVMSLMGKSILLAQHVLYSELSACSRCLLMSRRRLHRPKSSTGNSLKKN